MSHFTKVRTRMAEKEYLLKALTDLGLPYEEGNVEIRGWGGKRRKVEVKVPTRSRGYDIGFSKNGGDAYEMIADWWGIKEFSQRRLTEQLGQRYAYHAARARLESQGFMLVNEESQAGGRIHLVLRRMA